MKFVLKDNEARAGAVGTVTFGFWLIWRLSGFLFPSSGWWNAFPDAVIYLAYCISFLILARSKSRALAVVGACGYGLAVPNVMVCCIFSILEPEVLNGWILLLNSSGYMSLFGGFLVGIALWRLYAGRKKCLRLSALIGFFVFYLFTPMSRVFGINWLNICSYLIYNFLVGVGFVSLFFHANKEMKNHGN